MANIVTLQTARAQKYDQPIGYRRIRCSPSQTRYFMRFYGRPSKLKSPQFTKTNCAQKKKKRKSNQKSKRPFSLLLS